MNKICVLLSLAALLCSCQRKDEIIKTPKNIPFSPSGIHLELKNNHHFVNSFIPFEEVKCQLVFRDNLLKEIFKGSRDISFTPESKINGENILPEELDKMNKNGFKSGSGESLKEGFSWYHSFGRGGILPRSPGIHVLELVLQTPAGKWKLPPIHLDIYLPKEDIKSYEYFMDSDCVSFLAHEDGMRKTGSTEEQLNYGSVNEFIKKFPTSRMIIPISQRALRSWEKDCQREYGYFEEVDKREVAKIIGATKREYVIKNCNYYIGRFEKKLSGLNQKERESYENKIKIRKQWLRLVSNSDITKP